MEITGQHIVCQECGGPNPKEARFCRNCGKPLARVSIKQEDDIIGDSPTSFQFTDQDDILLAEGEVINNRYRVVRTLGGGGMGKVYQVWDTELEEHVALKIVLPALMNNEVALQRFKQEILICRKLKHTNIVSTFEFGEHHGLKFYTMAFLEGRNLTTVIADYKKQGHGFVPVKDTIRIIIKLLDALHYAHQFTVHRDVKPDNILILKNGEPILTDFGIAHAIEGEKKITGTGRRMGTAYYMAPEQLTRASEVDHRADIFAVGVILYEMLTGRLPVGRFRDPQVVNPTLPPGIGARILKAMEELPTSRYPSAEAMKRAFVPYLSDVPDFGALSNAEDAFFQGEERGFPSNPRIRANSKPKIALKKKGAGIATYLALFIALFIAVALPGFIYFDRLPEGIKEPLAPARQSALASLGELFHDLRLEELGAPKIETPSAPVEIETGQEAAEDGKTEAAIPAVVEPTVVFSLDTRPSGADLIIDGKKSEFKTPARELRAHAHTPHEIIISKQGYETKTVLLKPPYKEVEMLTFNLEPKKVSVVFISYPSSAKVLFAGTQQATTPLIIKNWSCLEPLPYLIKFSGGHQTSEVLNISPEDCDKEVIYLNKRLEGYAVKNKMGILNLYSSPSKAWVKIDGADIRYQTPIENYQLPEGNHIIEVYSNNTKPRCRGIYTVSINSGSKVTQNVKCHPLEKQDVEAP